MQTWHIILIIVLIFGIIVGNLLLLKSTANSKIPKIKPKPINEEDEDDW